jgi:hypothetical protein
MRPRGGLRAHEQKEQAHGLTIESVEFDGKGGAAGGHTQIGDGG